MSTEDPESFKKYVRMSVSQFVDLSELIKDDIQKMDTNFRPSICYQMRLAITLHFLATGDSFTSIKTSFRVGISTVSGIIEETCKAICNKLGSDKLRLTNSIVEWQRIEHEFKEKWNLPNCIGALDGKHIDIVAVPNSGSYYFNYKGRNSIVLMALVDANRRFIFVDIGCNGRVSDGGVFGQTTLYNYLEDQTNPLNIPPPQVLPGRNTKIPFYIVGDDAFPLKTYLMKPYHFRGLSTKEKVFNYRQSRARMNIENAFGMLASRFQIFKKPMPFLPNKVDLFVMTACILHNYLIEDIREEEALAAADINMNDMKVNRVNASSSAARMIRKELTEYCVNEGDLEWQYSKI